MDSIDKYLIDPSLEGEKRKIPEHESIRLLWIKVILRAAYDWVLYKDSKNTISKKIAKDAYKWLFDPIYERRRIIHCSRVIEVEDPSFNSLEKLCDSLDIDIDSVRRFASRLTRDQIKKLEFLDRSKKNKLSHQEDEISSLL